MAAAACAQASLAGIAAKARLAQRPAARAAVRAARPQRSAIVTRAGAVRLPPAITAMRPILPRGRPARASRPAICPRPHPPHACPLAPCSPWSAAPRPTSRPPPSLTRSLWTPRSARTRWATNRAWRSTLTALVAVLRHSLPLGASARCTSPPQAGTAATALPRLRLQGKYVVLFFYPLDFT